MERVRRGTPPISSVLTGHDVAVAGIGGALTGGGAAVFKGATAAAAIGAGVNSAGVSVAAVLLYNGIRQTVSTGLSYDEVNAQYKKDFDDCTATHGYRYTPVPLL